MYIEKDTGLTFEGHSSIRKYLKEVSPPAVMSDEYLESKGFYPIQETLTIEIIDDINLNSG